MLIRQIWPDWADICMYMEYVVAYAEQCDEEEGDGYAGTLFVTTRGVAAVAGPFQRTVVTYTRHSPPLATLFYVTKSF